MLTKPEMSLAANLVREHTMRLHDHIRSRWTVFPIAMTAIMQKLKNQNLKLKRRMICRYQTRINNTCKYSTKELSMSDQTVAKQDNQDTDTDVAQLTDGFHLVVDALKLNDINTIYNVPGIPITDLGRIAQAEGMCVISFRHEQHAGYAASIAGYLTKKPGVALTVSAPVLNGRRTANARKLFSYDTDQRIIRA